MGDSTIRFWIVILMTSIAAQVTSGKRLYTALDMKNKFACVAENLKEATTYYCDEQGGVRCLPGWADPEMMCKTPLCEVNNKTCINGRCAKPFVCTCDVGWTGQFCEECIRLPGCHHGTCSKAFECSCNEGWDGMICDKPLCENCLHGDCVMPNVCACHAGWTGLNCTECQPRVDCKYGTCEEHPFECKCFSKYNGSACDKPTCGEGCHPEHGYCTLPETCICHQGWRGPNCDACVPYWDCQGFCENDPWECICPDGRTGPDCKDEGDIDGNWGHWGEWSTCSATCGEGMRERKRECNNPRTQGEGKYCSQDGSSCEENEQCKTPVACPTDKVDGNWGHWEHWSACSVTCGGDGARHRLRRCNSPFPDNGGANCIGDTNQMDENCNSFDCPAGPTNGNWGSWETWSGCSKTCGKGTIRRTRGCNDPPPMNGGQPCAGNTIQNTDCNEGDCSVDGVWGDWSTWSTCSKSCGAGYNMRSRQCNNPRPTHDGLHCAGDAADQRHCDEGACPIDGEWSHWQHWSTCTVTCGGDGTRDRRRLCDNPQPANGGSSCQGPDQEHDFNCNYFECPKGPMNGEWGDWGTWEDCSASCGRGRRRRTRFCDNPEPKNGGLQCIGTFFDRESCYDRKCPIDGNWGSWNSWTMCTVSCGGGVRNRTRNCDNPVPSDAGKDCINNDSEQGACYTQNCPIHGGWSEWSEYSDCNVTCTDQLGGTQVRTRKCDNPEPKYGGIACSQFSNGEHDREEMGCNGTIESQTIDPNADCYIDLPAKLFHPQDDNIPLNDVKMNIPLSNTINQQDDIIIRDSIDDEKTATVINDKNGNGQGDTIINGTIDIYR